MVAGLWIIIMDYQAVKAKPWNMKHICGRKAHKASFHSLGVLHITVYS